MGVLAAIAVLMVLPMTAWVRRKYGGSRFARNS
jgi:hypothetical protein